MADTTTQILIKLLSTGDLSALAKGKEQSEALKVSLEGLKGALELVGVGLSLGAALEGIKTSVEFASNIKRLSDQAGISTKAFQELSYAAAGAGVNQDGLATSLNVLQRNLAQAANGATKQNAAIHDLGLNTAELLSMPVEQQVEAIARAYVGASDKGKAWADVTALLGKNSAEFKQVLNELGTAAGLAGIEVGRMISDEDIKRIDKMDNAWKRLKMSIEAATASAVVTVMEGKNPSGLSNADFGLGGIDGSKQTVGAGTFRGHGAGGEWETDEEHKAKIAAIQAALEATIQSSPQMISAHVALTKALNDETKAYEGPVAAAKRLREEAASDEAQAAKFAANKFDAAAQLEALKLQTSASALRGQANAEDAKAAKEKAQYDAAEVEMAQRMAQAATALLPINEQLVQARAHQTDLAARLAALDVTSLTYRQDHLKVEGDILANKREISALEERDAAASLERQAKSQEIQNRREAIALASIEHDYNLTDTQKWEEKRAILNRAVTEQETYIANMKRIAGDASAPAGARDKASQLADQGENALAGTKSALATQGPSPTSFTANLKKDLSDLQRQWGTLQQSMARGLTGVISSGFSSVSREISKAIVGAQTLGQAFQNVAVSIGETLVQALVDMGVQWIATEAMKLAFGTTAKAADTATSVAAAEAASLAWATPAALASVASFGAADIAGMTGLTAAVAMANTIGAVGFADGGFTGGTEGAAAGIVHGNEFVWSAPAVRAVGVGNLERAHQAALGGGGGVSAAGGASGRASGNIILAMSAGDVAKSQRAHVDARVVRMSGMIPQARYAL